MGWLTGFSGVSVPEDLLPPHEHPRHTIRDQGLYAQAGGLKETCNGGKMPGGGKFLVTGLGIWEGRTLEQDDWATRLNGSVTVTKDLDGHFVALRWRPGRTEFFSDSAGVRTIYFLERAEGVYFSTRLDWLASCTGPLKIDLDNFSAQWMLPNSMRTSSIVKHVLRLEPGGFAVIEQGHVRLQSRPWKGPTTSLIDSDGTAFTQALRNSVEVKGPLPWSLGLSGGLDSRVLQAFRGNGITHVWGPSDHPDVVISSKLAQTQGVEQNYIQYQLPDVTECIRILRERVSLTQVITPASVTILGKGYSRLHAMGFGVVDGGLGGIARRQLMNRIVFERILCRDSPNRPLSCPRIGKSDIFIEEIQRLMTLRAKEHLNEAWNQLPQNMTVAEKADLLWIRTHLPNAFGFEQNFLDHVCVSYMPYAQPSVLRALMQVPLRLRWHGRLLRSIIRQYSPSLSSFPLVKGTTTYPYRLGTISSVAYAKIKEYPKRPYHDPRPQEFLLHLKEFILDTLRSNSVRSYHAYDQKKLRSMADRFARGDTRCCTQLDWWLAFEMWRKVLSLQLD